MRGLSRASLKFSRAAPSWPRSSPLTLDVAGVGPTSALFRRPASARACFVMAHNAGAGMSHPSLQAVSDGIAKRLVATLRFQFPFMEAGSKRPDRPAVAHVAVRAAVGAVGRLAPDLPLVAGKRSFGGRMTSQAQVASMLPGVRGLAFLGFPLHPAGRPSNERGRHLADVTIPMLFCREPGTPSPSSTSFVRSRQSSAAAPRSGFSPTPTMPFACRGVRDAPTRT